MRHLLGSLSLAALSFACNSTADQGAFDQKGTSQQKPAATLSATEGALNVTQQVTTAAAVDFNIDVRSVSGTKLCSGSASIDIKSNFTMSFPAATLKCASLTLDLAGLLGNADLSKGLDNTANFNSDGKVLSLAALSGATFDPPRPFLLGPIIQDASSYTGFTRSVPEKMTYNDPVSNKPVTVTGQFDVQVFDADTTYTNNYLGKGFDHVMHWQITSTGFTGVSAKTGLIFKKMEWVWSIRPIMIPKLIIVGTLSDFISKESTSDNADAFVGELTIELTATAYKQQ